VVVFLGDYIDRGPASRDTVEHLMGLGDRFDELVFLRGNHEQVLLDIVDGVETSTRWLEFGGRQTLISYGVPPRLSRPSSVAALRALALKHIPQSHLAFLRQTQVTRSLGDYLFVHGGLKPDRLLSEHSDNDLLWFRYLVDEAPLWKHMVVHGHAAHVRPVEGRSHIGIDTGAYATGALTVLRLEGASREFLKISRPQTGAGVSGSGLEVGVWERRDSTYPESGAFELAADWSRGGAAPVRFWDRLGFGRRP
jgi:serine/threonine protein phosphatase 1